MQFLSHNGLARPMHFHCLDAVSYGMTTVKEARPEETCNDRALRQIHQVLHTAIAIKYRYLPSGRCSSLQALHHALSRKNSAPR